MSSDKTSSPDFWSRRKAAVRQAEQEELRQKDLEETAERQAELASKTDEEILEELQLPDPDELTDQDDFKPFLSAAVPERLKRRALRRLWGLNPVLANLDGLVDYAEDYTDAATVVSNMQTVYQVGKGMFDKFAEAVQDEETADLTDGDVKSGEIESSIAAPQHNNQDVQSDDFIEKRNTSIHWPATDGLVQDAKQRVVCVESEELNSDDVEQIQPTRRRMRFDYS